MLRKTLLTASLLTTFGASAYTMETVTVDAPITGIKNKAAVVLPSSYNEATSYPVVYLLHGHGGNYRDWTNLTGVESLADRHNIIVVMPDGNRDSWYVDSKLKTNSDYATYISEDVVNYIDANYNTINRVDGRGITGLSMGGFGAMSIGFNNLDTFGAIGAISGGVDFTPFPKNWGISEVLGKYDENKTVWHQNAIINNLHKVTEYEMDGSVDKRVPISFEVGVGDFFLDVNRELHKTMLQLNIKHDYTERQGQHDWNYWNNAIAYQMQFMNDALRKQGAFAIKG